MFRVALMLMLASPVHAESCADEVARLRAHAETAARHTSQWNWAWRITYTTAAVGSLAVAIANPVPSLQDGLYVSAGKAAIAAAGRWILPLGLDVPASSGDACADAAALRAAIAATGKQERNLFWLGHLGSLVLNGAGFLILWRVETLDRGLISLATGVPVGLLSVYTMPRASWHLWRASSWSIAYVPRKDGWLVTLGGEL